MPRREVQPTLKTPTGMFLMDPFDEFEGILVRMAEMHREKSKAYGAGGDKLNNFYNIAKAEGITPLQAAAALAAKHRSVKREYIWGNFPLEHNKYTDDAFIDDCVYAVIQLELYEREAGETTNTDQGQAYLADGTPPA